MIATHFWTYRIGADVIGPVYVMLYDHPQGKAFSLADIKEAMLPAVRQCDGWYLDTQDGKDAPDCQEAFDPTHVNPIQFLQGDTT